MVASSALKVVTAGELSGGHENAHYSDEEAVEQERIQSNIVQSDLVLQEGVDVYIVEAKSKKRIKLSLGQDSVVCAVCGQTGVLILHVLAGHTAGFVGAVYIDCPVKPCYLCKQPGHTAATCPHRMDPTHRVTPVASLLSQNLLCNLQQREVSLKASRLLPGPPQDTSWKIRCVIQKLHKKRVTCMDFPPRSMNLVTSADKKGQISVWDFEDMEEHTSFEGIHDYQVNSLKFLPARDSMSLLTACCLGRTCLTDIETGMHSKLFDLNPKGWIQGVSNEMNWQMMCSVGVHSSHSNTAWCGDNKGKLRCLDVRNKSVESTTSIHGSGKVTSLEFHPRNSNLLLSAGNDHSVNLFDVRRLTCSADTARKGRAEPLLTLSHPRVVSKAMFSPHTGSRIVTTCGDNRLRVWDDVARAGDSPDREIVHSHDFNRYLTNFQAVFDPKDQTERCVVIGRYISEVHDGFKLHPIDFIDVGTGATIRSLTDPNLGYINALNMPHPLLDVVITGSSRDLFCWRPEEEDDEDEEEQGSLGDKDTSITASRAFHRHTLDVGEKNGNGKRKAK